MKAINETIAYLQENCLSLNVAEQKRNKKGLTN